jgi:Xaa-Pro aminopeptidase
VTRAVPVFVLAVLAICGRSAAHAQAAGHTQNAPELTHEEYRARRAALRSSLNGVVVLHGAVDPSDLHESFHQDPNFEYLTGWEEPGAAVLLAPKEEILFLPPRVANRETYNGRTTGPDENGVPAKTGFDRVLPLANLDAEVRRATAAPLARIDDKTAAELIGKLRMRKSPAEIALIRKATESTVAAHLAAWKRMQPGLFEYQIAATMVGTYEDLGCERSAYAPIVASGPNAVILHYSANRRRIEAGELVIMDVGAECSGYTTDITRTVPAGGKFTPRQRELYEIVLGAQKAAIAAVKPGMSLLGEDPHGASPGSLRKIAYDYINSHGKDLHGAALGKYFVHGLGHYVGLEVHDPGSFRAKLEPGMVITIEPGIYIAEEGIGIRIEDTVLVTETGAEVLSSALPKEIQEIERLVGK